MNFLTFKMDFSSSLVFFHHFRLILLRPHFVFNIPQHFRHFKNSYEDTIPIGQQSIEKSLCFVYSVCPGLKLGF